MHQKLLSELDHRELEESLAAPYPKWSSLCRLRLAGFSTLDGVYLEPGSENEAVCAAASRLAMQIGSETLMVRSDGGRELREYFKGGNTFSLNRVCTLAMTLLSQGRAVILLEPTNRFANVRTVNSISRRAGREGSLLVDILGAGYDVSDLTRGSVPPKVTIHISMIDWTVHAYPNVAEIKIHIDSADNDSDRRTRRLSRIGTEILPQLGFDTGNNPGAFAECWLRERGYTFLWKDWCPAITRGYVRNLFDDAFLVASVLPETCGTFAFAGSDLGDRFVYWDIVDSATKWTMPSRISAR